MPAPLAPMGLNPFEEAVVEAVNGRRWVATEQGWQEEGVLEPLRACRTPSPEDLPLVLASLAVPSVSASFQHRPARAFAVWSSLPGTVTDLSDPFLSSIEARQDPAWKAFQAGVEAALGERGWRLWRSASLSRRPRWDRVVRAQGPLGLPRGVAYGLASRLPQDEPWDEVGLSVDDADAGGLEEALDVRRGAGLLPPKGRKSGFQGPLAPSPGPAAPARAALVWVPRLSAAQAQAWSAWVDGGGVGVWALPCPVPASWVAQRERWRASGALKNGCRITDNGVAVAELWAVGRAVEWQGASHDLLAWAGDPPALSRPALLPALDAAGRVPYRALSRLSEPEGCAPRRLEACMHSALSALARHTPDIDQSLADALACPRARLGEALSPEQVDAVAAAQHAMGQGAGFLLADETGFGKGRVVAALAHIGLRQGRTVVVVTENAPLFSDLYRDLLAVGLGEAPLPTLLHAAATLRSPGGDVVAKSLKPADQVRMMARDAWEAGESPLVFTTYAQLGRGSGEAKIAWLKARMGQGAWVLLDEAHNAAGDSAIAEHMADLIASAGGVLFASATFARHEGNLNLYARALPLDSEGLKRLQVAMVGDDGRLRETLTQAMAQAGRLMRREHAPIPPPEPLWVAMTPEVEAACLAFSVMWQRLFDVSEAWELAQGKRGGGAWLKLGAALSRSIREFSLLVKAPALLQEIRRRLAQDEKVVVVLDTTLEAALRESLNGQAPSAQEGQEEAPSDAPAKVSLLGRREGAAPLWRDRWKLLLQSVVDPKEWSTLPTASPHRARLESTWALAIAAMDHLPAWGLSPLDGIVQALAAEGIAAGELSGRQLTLTSDATGWSIANRPSTDRQELVRSFNDGRIDVVFLTRAGCAGISLHAGKTFADQRRRFLLEWDIAANPVSRVQFWGRIRRKDQVREPGFGGLALDTPSDRRIQAREARKRQRLAAHSGVGQAEPLGLISPEGEALVAEWAMDRPEAARRLGVLYELPGDPTGRVDRALGRSVVLPDAERLALLSRLDQGLRVAEDVGRSRRQDANETPSRGVRRRWWCGNPLAPDSGRQQGMGKGRVDVVERVAPSSPSASEAEVVASVQAAHQDGRADGPIVLERWLRDWSQETSQGQEPTEYRRQVWQWAARVLPNLKRGFGVRLGLPDSERPTPAVVLAVSPPDDPYRAGGASPWALSQVAVHVFPAGRAAPIWVPLSDLAQDEHFATTGVSADPAWFRRPSAPRRWTVLEGDPVVAAAWGRRWRLGRPQLFADDAGSDILGWVLPYGWTWERLRTLPRDLLDVRHALDFWRRHPEGSLSATVPWGERVVATLVPGGVSLTFDEAAHQRALAEWINRPSERSLSVPKKQRGPQGWEVVRFLPMKGLARWLHSVEGMGVGWRVGPEHEAWYRASCAERWAP